MVAALSNKEFNHFQKYIKEQCGIAIGDEKAYLIESRLTKLLIETKLNTFEELYEMLYHKRDPKLSEKVIDAITTNETLWFRDKTPWIILENELIPQYIEKVRKTKQRIRIWSAAASSGQEAYSTVISIHQHLKKNQIKDVTLNDFEIIGTDISAPILEIAKAGRYDPISIMRGLDPKLKETYFQNEGRIWIFKDEFRKHVKFRKFNLQNSFNSMSQFDVIFCRYVMIYFSQEFKREMTKKLAQSMKPGGILFIGNSEIFPEHKDYFETKKSGKGIYYQVKE